MDRTEYIIGSIFLVLIIIFLMFAFYGEANKLHEFKKQAIENNAANYVVDSEGNVTFEWITE